MLTSRCHGKKENNFELYLHVDSARPIYVDFECKINEIKESYFNQLFDSNLTSWGWFKFGTKEELFVDRVMTIEWTVKLKSEPSLSFGNIGADLLDEEQFSDFTICCGEKEFKVHKNVLAAASPVFSAMFKQDCQEAAENKVDITDFDADIVELGIKFIYERELLMNLNYEKVMKLWDFADKYDLRGKDRIDEWLLCNIKNETVCLIANFAKKKEIKKVYDKCVKFCVKEFNKIYTFDNFEQFDAEIVKEILVKKLSVNT
uniref:BTB domain-containing protein n=1 Tax=Panagrolaimus sp. JU765 TaxID=591449 RepID=A0AC34RMN8_9BILA